MGFDVQTVAGVGFGQRLQLGWRQAACIEHQVENPGAQQLLLRHHVGVGEFFRYFRRAGQEGAVEIIEKLGFGAAAPIALKYQILVRHGLFHIAR